MYYGLCLHKGKYIVTLHFSETLYSKGEDHSITGKRVFDVYIQGRLVKKDLNIKEIPELQNEVRKLKFPAKINEGSLEIKLFWAGKGSLYNPPGINGPLIEAISVTRGRKLLFLFMLKPCRILFQKTTSLGNRVDYNRLSFVSHVVVGVLLENGLDRRQKIAQWALSKALLPFSLPFFDSFSSIGLVFKEEESNKAVEENKAFDCQLLIISLFDNTVVNHNVFYLFSALILINRLLLLLVSLLLWQLGTGTTFNIGTKAAAANGDNTKALELLASSLQTTEEDAEIRCSCDNSNEVDFENLKILDLSNNMLTGVIPTSLGKLQHLERLNLANNILTGSIPDNLTALQSLIFLDLTSNALTGSIPASLTTLHNLTILKLAYNNLHGEIPQNLTGLQSLGSLDLESNKLTGSIPDSISYCKNLTTIILRLNNLRGAIPQSLGSLSKLETFCKELQNQLLSYMNVVVSTIIIFILPLLSFKHDCFFITLSAIQCAGIFLVTRCQAIFLSNWEILNLDDNDLEGNLPEELGKLRKLENLYLSSNKFNGSIPATYAQLVNLQVFVVGGNYLSGKIPNYFGKWVNLTKLILIGNNFKGNLPAETFSLPKLQILLVSDVSNPAGIYFPNVIEVMPGNLNQVVLRNCNIWGQIPEYIGRWRQLMISVRDLSFNNLTGRIPDSFQNTISKLYVFFKY
ncbi:uncharacterized protein [Populus alba]|uniref:uncharacterized protein n=1 Tax=Populus alba TaxID=43335 RepID=UPI003CC7747A